MSYVPNNYDICRIRNCNSFIHSCKKNLGSWHSAFNLSFKQWIHEVKDCYFTNIRNKKYLNIEESLLFYSQRFIWLFGSQTKFLWLFPIHRDYKYIWYCFKINTIKIRWLERKNKNKKKMRLVFKFSGNFLSNEHKKRFILL